VAARELADLDAVELTWSCLDDSRPAIYLVQSSSTTGKHHPTSSRRRLRAAADTALWRVVAEVTCSVLVGYRHCSELGRLVPNRCKLDADASSSDITRRHHDDVCVPPLTQPPTLVTLHGASSLR